MLWKKGRRECEGIGAILKILLNRDLEEVREKVIANIWERVLHIEGTVNLGHQEDYLLVVFEYEQGVQCIWSAVKKRQIGRH